MRFDNGAQCILLTFDIIILERMMSEQILSDHFLFNSPIVPCAFNSKLDCTMTDLLKLI